MFVLAWYLSGLCYTGLGKDTEEYTFPLPSVLGIRGLAHCERRKLGEGSIFAQFHYRGKCVPKIDNNRPTTRIWLFRENETIYSQVYTLAMAKHVYVQVRGVNLPNRIAADEVKEETTVATDPIHRLKLSLAGKPVGEFKFEVVDGWWIED